MLVEVLEVWEVRGTGEGVVNPLGVATRLLLGCRVGDESPDPDSPRGSGESERERERVIRAKTKDLYYAFVEQTVNLMKGKDLH